MSHARQSLAELLVVDSAAGFGLDRMTGAVETGQ
jgi:hypothetical protein